MNEKKFVALCKQAVVDYINAYSLTGIILLYSFL